MFSTILLLFANNLSGYDLCILTILFVVLLYEEPPKQPAPEVLIRVCSLYPLGS